MPYSKNHLNIILETLQQRLTETYDLVTITGPTCTGKTDLSLALAKELNIPIINADSRLIFDEMNIGTAKPSLEELNSIKHYLVNIRKANENYSAGEYRKDFDEIINKLKKENYRKPLAIVVGGTGFYLRAALDNLDMPEVSKDHDLRNDLIALDLDALNKILNQLDPNAYKDVDTKNKVRIIRAIEIIKSTSKSLNEARGINSENRYKTLYFALNFSRRRILYDLIDARVIKMINKGLVHEVEDLINKYGVTDTLMSTIGYREIIGYLNKERSISDARREIQKRTRNYAKKQLTWFNKNKDIIWLNADENLIPSRSDHSVHQES